MKNIPEDKTLNVNQGVERNAGINEESARLFKQKKRNLLSTDEYLAGILSGSRTILSKAITLVESSLPAHFEPAQEIVERCLPYSGSSLRIGITGVPGVGKSTFIESLGVDLINKGRKLAVLAIDPSSERSKGSILGDKTRMEKLAAEPAAFIRPSPSAGSLGGVARKTRETIVLCEAAGYDTLFIETIGVGQSEIAVHSMVDFFLLLMLAGAGDALQGIKRGVMEMADLIAITKADGTNNERAKRARNEYEMALHLFPARESAWIPKVLTCSSVNHRGIDDVWNTIMDYHVLTTGNGYFEKNRRDQSLYWMHETINQQLKEHFYKNTLVKGLLAVFEEKVLAGRITPFTPAQKLLEAYYKDLNSGGAEK